MSISIETGKDICEALGLDPSQVQSIDIHIEAGCIMTAMIREIVKPGLAVVLKEYELVPIEQATLKEK